METPPSLETAVPAAPLQPPTGTTELPKKSTRKNFLLAWIDIVGFTSGNYFFAPQAILQEFATHLTSKSWVIGLTTSAPTSLIAVTQLLVAKRVERLPIKKWWVIVVAAFERLAILVLALLTPWLAGSHPTAMMVVLACLLAFHFGAMGSSIPAYSAMIAKVIPPRQRGIMYGAGGTVGNFITFGAGFVIPIMLTSALWWGGFPNGFALCFLIAFLLMTVSYVPLAWIDEPRETPSTTRVAPREFCRELTQTLKVSHDFRYFLISTVFLMFGGVGLSFYMTYAIRNLGAPVGESGIFTVILALGAMSSVLWGLFADRTDNRTALLVSGTLAVIGAVWAVFAPSLVAFYPVIFLSSVAMRGMELSGYTIQMEFGSEAQVPRYVALSGAVQFLPRLVAPIIGGAVADLFGFQSVFWFGAVCSAAGVAVVWKMRDPRRIG
ncbi:MAG: MFS transporter [Candidatus Poribacteria bacterium]|nr:MFS transporter [Candidatus Poribacteria bacterium]